MKVKATGLLALTLVSGIALACTMKAMPPFIIDVSAWDLAVATVQGYANPSGAAAMKNLDEAGTTAVGSSNWVANNYIGPVTFRVSGSGANLVTVDKPCNQKAIDSLESTRDEEEGTAATGGGGGYIWYGGGIYNSGGTCLYGCNTGRVTVGDVDPV